MKTKFLAVLVIMISLAFSQANAQTNTDEAFIYGKVITIDGDEYVGPIRWGTEEVFWFDFFNATKPRNEFVQYLSRQEIEDLRETSKHWAERWIERLVSVNGWDDSYNHTFACQFGDIKVIEVRGRNRVNLELKDGQVIRLDDGSNDVGARIRILDEEYGSVEVKWDRLDRVEFYPTPENLSRKFGDPIFGTVHTRYGEISGFIQWDHDERLLSDKLDGDTRHDDYSIPFEDIRSMEKYGRGVLLITKSGDELELHSSNDVNRENRGIIVNTAGMGRVDIPWKEFEKIVFSNPNDGDVVGYDDFNAPESLSGTVHTVDGNSYSGLIIYDLDESINIEILNGEKDDIEYLIPFRSIKKVIPKNYYYSQISLRDGDLLLLGKSQDVTDSNTGVLVFESENNYKYIPWAEIEEIVFK